MSVSSFYGLQTALRGLLSQQRSIDVTGHNIANVSTQGYSRQEAVLQASPALLVPAGALSSGAGAQLGSGVDVQAYRRVRDGFLDAQFRAQNMRLGYQTATARSLSDAELALAEPGDDGIASQLAGFWDAWSDFANAPEDPAARQALVQRGATLAGSFATVDAQLASLAGQAGGEYASLTGAGGRVDTISRELAQLNGSISQAVQAGEAPNDLLDRRDLLIDQLSQLGQVSVTAEANGSVTVAFGDAANPLVQGTTADWPQALSSPGGRLGALKQLSEPGGTLETYRSELSAVAQTLADTVNGVHGAPPFFSYTPGAAASTLAVAVAPADVQATAGTAAGANELALAVAALRGGAADGGYRTFVTGIGTAVNEAVRQEANAQALTDSADNRRASVAGVSLDEEMTNLVRFQRAYQASARAMSTMDEMLEQLIQRTGRVGL